MNADAPGQAPAAAGGQAPTTTTGQAPTTAPAGSATGGAAAGSLADAAKTYDEAYVTQLRQEAAGYRIAAQKAADDLKKLQDAQLSETELRERRLAELEARQADWDRERQELLTRAAVERAARKAGLASEEAAFKLLDLAAVEYDAEGQPQNLDALLTDLVKAYPFLASQPGGPMHASSPAHPAAGRSTTLTRDDIKQMTAEQINANWEQVSKVLAGG